MNLGGHSAAHAALRLEGTMQPMKDNQNNPEVQEAELGERPLRKKVLIVFCFITFTSFSS